MYDIAALYEATSVSNAVELRLAHPEAIVIAGGTDVLIQVRSGKLAGRELISIHGLSQLRGVSLTEDGTICIGPLTTFAELIADPIILQHIPVLAQAVEQVGGPQIRAAGTIGGNLCNGVTSADSASTLLAWDAQVELTGKNGTRQLPLSQFYVAAGQVDLAADELLTAIYLPAASYTGFSGHYIKYAMRSAMDISTANCSVNVSLSQDKSTITCVRVAFGVTGPVPMRAASAEAALTGQPVCAQSVQAFGEAILSDIQPRDSWRATKEFRTHICQELAKRCLTQAIELAGGTI